MVAAGIASCHFKGSRGGWKYPTGYITNPKGDPEDHTGDGGSILIHGTKNDTVVSINESEFSGCEAYCNGGAINAALNSSMCNRSYFPGWFGALPTQWPDDLCGGCDLHVTSVKFNECQAGWQGGAVSLCGNEMAVKIDGTTAAPTIFTSCKAGLIGDLWNGHGGAISIGGGRRFFSPTSLTTVRQTQMRNCEASGNGGAVYVTISGSISFHDTEISGCSARASEPRLYLTGRGGGVHVSAGGVMRINDGTRIHDNTAAQDGGGLSVKSGRCIITADSALGEEVLITGNAAQGNQAQGVGDGGGICITSSGFDPEDAWVGIGAAILYGPGTLRIAANPSSYVSVTSNSAARWGGGLYAGLSMAQFSAKESTLAYFSFHNGRVETKCEFRMNTARETAEADSLFPSQIAFELRSPPPSEPDILARSARSWIIGSAIEGRASDIGDYWRRSLVCPYPQTNVLYSGLGTNRVEAYTPY